MTAYTSGTPGIGIVGTGSYLPARVVSNAEVGARAGVDNEWILRKTGIRERRYAAPYEATSDLAAAAARSALDDAGITADQLSWVIVATSTPDRPQPATACLVQDRIGAVNAAAYDINAVCAGFVFALLTGAQLLAGTETGIAPGYGLVIGADTYSRIIDPQDRRTAPLFGDGAGAVVLGPVPSDRGLVGGGAATDGGRHGDIRVEAGGSRLPASEKTVYEEMHFFRMEGRRVREYVTEQLPRAVQEVLGAYDIDPVEVDHFIPHQANGQMLTEVLPQLDLPLARTYLTVDEHGNTSAASIPLALDQVRRAGMLLDGELLLLAGFGGGMSLGTALLRWAA